MKRNILFLIMAVMGITGLAFAAGDNKPIEVACYEVDGELVYEISGCVPGSDIAFYSQRWGGVHLKDATVNEAGSIKIVADEKFTPALVVNLDNKNGKGIAGNGMVSLIGNKEFTLNNMQVKNNEGATLLTWNASVRDMDEYVFEVFKSINGSGYELMATLTPSSAAMAGYSYTDNAEKGHFVSYEIRISNKKEVNYISRSLIPDNKCGITLYPTVSSDKIYTSFSRKASSEPYNIIDIQGRIVLSGILGEVSGGIPIENLAAGHYIFQVVDQDQTCISKFVKQ